VTVTFRDEITWRDRITMLMAIVAICLSCVSIGMNIITWRIKANDPDHRAAPAGPSILLTPERGSGATDCSPFEE
jgi:hypothetical protein